MIKTSKLELVKNGKGLVIQTRLAPFTKIKKIRNRIITRNHTNKPIDNQLSLFLLVWVYNLFGYEVQYGNFN